MDRCVSKSRATLHFLRLIGNVVLIILFFQIIIKSLCHKMIFLMINNETITTDKQSHDFNQLQDFKQISWFKNKSQIMEKMTREHHKSHKFSKHFQKGIMILK